MVKLRVVTSYRPHGARAASAKGSSTPSCSSWTGASRTGSRQTEGDAACSEGQCQDTRGTGTSVPCAETFLQPEKQAALGSAQRTPATTNVKGIKSLTLRHNMINS